MNRLYHDPRDSSVFTEKREYVKISERTTQRFWGKVKEAQNGCYEWQGGLFETGYGHFFLDGKTFSTHRTAFCLSRGYFPTGLHVCHKCDNRKCVRPDHLFSGTARDNLLDMSNKGRSLKGDRNPSRTQNVKMPRGKAHGNAVLTDDQIHEIRWFCDRGCTYPQVAPLYGISPVHIGYVARRQIWKHVPEESGVPFVLKRRNSEHFSDEEVRAIRRLRSEGKTYREIAQIYNVPSAATIYTITSRKQYKNVL